MFSVSADKVYVYECNPVDAKCTKKRDAEISAEFPNMGLDSSSAAWLKDEAFFFVKGDDIIQVNLPTNYDPLVANQVYTKSADPHPSKTSELGIDQLGAPVSAVMGTDGISKAVIGNAALLSEHELHYMTGPCNSRPTNIDKPTFLDKNDMTRV